MRKFIKSILPPILLYLIRMVKDNKYGWKGDYATWQDARKDSIGYETDDGLDGRGKDYKFKGMILRKNVR